MIPTYEEFKKRAPVKLSLNDMKEIGRDLLATEKSVYYVVYSSESSKYSPFQLEDLHSILKDKGYDTEYFEELSGTTLVVFLRDDGRDYYSV